MNRRRPRHYFSALLVLLLLGAIANVEFSSNGRAVGRHAKDDIFAPGGADPGVNAFANGAKHSLDLAFYDEFMRTSRIATDGFAEDKTGQWSRGSPKSVAAFMQGKGPDLQNASDIASVLSKQSGVHAGGLLAPGGDPLTTSELVTAALMGAGPLVLPHVIRGGFTAPVGPPPPPTSEVPVPPAGLLFVSALGLAAFRRCRSANV
jgi:hypothetical protein